MKCFRRDGGKVGDDVLLWQPQKKRANEWEVSRSKKALKICEASDKEKLEILHFKNPIAIQSFLANWGNVIFHKTSFTTAHDLA